MQKLQKVLGDPKVALVLALSAIGLTFSPKISLAGTRLCFLAAFAAGGLCF